jgi:hypothetical protein
MSKINEIDLIFSDCLDAVMSGQSTVADCLKHYPEHASELEGLLATSLEISHAAEIIPPAGARMRIRVALNERMAELSGRKPKTAPFWRLGWANVVATFIMGLSLAGGGVAYAASGAMPGEALYPLKLNLEEALVSITFSSDAKVELYAALNDRRVDEIVFLAQRGDSQAIVEVTTRIESNLSAAAAAKGISANEYATAKASPADSQIPPSLGIAATEPPTTPTSTNPVPITRPETTTPPVFGSGSAVNTVSVPAGSSALDNTLGNYANNQLNELTGAANAGNSPAVQAALDMAIAAIKNGYDALIT